MDPLDVRDFILTLPLVEEVLPFGEDEAVVYKIGGKWFAVHIFSRPDIFAVKCHPDRAILLRDQYPAITPAWHFNKRHWNDICVDYLPDTQKSPSENLRGICASDGNRTRTAIAGHGILSPACLPIPPPRRMEVQR